jgi:hypothetical protein
MLAQRKAPALLFASLFALALLAGCAGGGNGADQPTGEDFQDLDLEATETTGIIRGVVVDEAVRPVAGAVVSLSGSTASNTTTNDDGLFGFSNLQPGPHFVRVSKAGYVAAQASTEVVAGLADPPILKVLLTADPSSAPYVATYVFDGFIECSFSLVAVGFAACSSAEQFNDRFSDTYEIDQLPDWAQAEMVWDSTQAASDSLGLVFSVPPRESTLYDNYAEAGGPSPLVIQANQTTMEEYGVLEQGVIFRVFNEPIEGTEPGDPVNGDDCLDRPQLGGCATGFGFTVEQSFQVYTNLFYGFTPDPAWRFVESGPHPVPT